MVELDGVAELCGLEVALLLLAVGFFDGAEAGGLFLGLDALLFEAGIEERPALHEVGEGAEAVFVDGIVGDDGGGVDPEEAVAEVAVGLDAVNYALGFVLELYAEVGELGVVLGLGVEVGYGGGGVGNPSAVEAVVWQEVGDAEDGGGLRPQGGEREDGKESEEGFFHYCLAFGVWGCSA